jgi:hypothetical protein
MIVQLLKTDGENNEFILLSGKDEYLLGREEGDLVLGDERTSRRHALLYRNSEDQLCIRDLKSTNGTIVNKQKVTETVLAPEDTFRLGRTIFIFFSMQIEAEGASIPAGVTRKPINVDAPTQGSSKKAPLKAVPSAPSASKSTRNTGTGTKIPLVIDPRGDGYDGPDLVAPGKLGSVLLTTWPDNFRSLKDGALLNFIDHMDEDQKQKSRRLLALAKDEDSSEDAA